ncbi:class I SAM-dependent RNA methyltransferase [Rhodovulum sp. DZ06]|uniref:class I SAM-dependent RNA methyltransferase n=1 Tax=Rhodovulum sp. DZ06 TaxID=3425126 RepID=UPI003D3583D8
MTETQTELTIDRLGHRGDGVAHGPEGEVFAPFTLPGEVVRGEVSGGRMAAPKIAAPSAHRVKAPCPAFGRCGGCALQHASDAFVAGWKRDAVAAALAARGLQAEILETATSPDRSRRRAVLSGRRTKKTVLLGFHAARDAEIVPLADACPLLRPEILEGRAGLEALVARAASRKGELRLSVTVSLNGLDIAATGARPLDGPLRLDLARLAGEFGWARLVVDDEPIATARPPHQPFGKARVAPAPGGFLQATAEGEAAILSEIRAVVGKAARVVDLFCGAGAFALPLAETAEVLAVEGDGPALAALEAGWRATGGALRKVVPLKRDLFRRPLLAAEMKGFQAAVIDPPRAGAEAQTAELAALAAGGMPGPERIAAVSCNPATFARDARALVDAGWRMGPVRPVDQFRWAPHVELTAGFTRG